MSFNALVLDQVDDELTVGVRSLEVDDLPEADTVVDVLFSSINYKDALAVTGEGRIIRGGFPIVPGIDLVGRVRETASSRFAVGDHVIGTGWGLGENVWGGYTQTAKVEADKLVALPDGMTPRQSMVIGTAGFTAMLSVMALEEHGAEPGAGEILVTGASGGAGSMATAILAELGFDAVASTGSEDAHAYLRDLGASRIVDRHEFSDGPARAMESGQWAGAVDAVGGKTLATIIAQLERHGSVAAFGNAGGASLETTVFPFILRGVNLLGIDSNTCPTPRREAAWERLANVLDEAKTETMTHSVVGLDGIEAAARTIYDTGIRGRIVVDVQSG